MKTIKKPAPRVLEAMELLARAKHQLTIDEVAAAMSIKRPHAKTLLRDMVLSGRASKVQPLYSAAGLYGPAQQEAE